MKPLELLWAALATVGFALRFEARPRDLPLAAAGAALGWGVYAAAAPASTPAAGLFLASLAIGLWAELAAGVLKRPATIFVVCAIIPLVPGGGMYNTMLDSVRGDTWQSIRTGFQTLQAAGAIAAGLAVSSALSRLLSLSTLARRLAGRGRGGAPR